MCGIAGLQITNPRLRPRLGEFLVPMLGMLAGRGPDSTGVAIYSGDAPPGAVKYSLRAPRDGYDWDELARSLQTAGDGTGPPEVRRRGRDAILVTERAPDHVRELLASIDPQVRMFGHGAAIEVYKDTGSALDVCTRYGVQRMAGYQGVGHTRMATESAVTTEHSHPFSTGLDLCLVHNGSLSNHNRLRRSLQREGIRFQTDNDTEVAAGYLTWRLREGATLEQALESCLDDLDGFYTFCVGTAGGFAVLRDPIACKPAVMAETDEWVAMASEYRAIAVLPGAEEATMWEPVPGRVYSWGTALVA